jgi:hypothetical protein
MKCFVAAAVVIGLFAVSGLVGADDKPKAEDKSKTDDKSKLVGTWKMTIHMGERTIEGTLELKMDGDKLTGTLTGSNGRDQQLDEVTFKNGELSFSITRERNGQKRVMKWSGKVTGDTMKGKADRAEWEAKRAKEGT